MKDAQAYRLQLTEILSLNESKTWDDFRFYNDSERDEQPVLSISRDLHEEFNDVDSDFIQNICKAFDTEEYEITVATDSDLCELIIKFYDVSVAVDGIVDEVEAE